MRQTVILATKLSRMFSVQTNFV
ncbi:unnamed protein product [Debaryomyces tyrocola]|nr:unnamed protein product [Debaryomyces tyrocola]